MEAKTMGLFSAFVPGARQIVAAAQGVLDKGEAFCAANGAAPAGLIDLRLAPDMASLPFQVFSVAHHTAGAIAGVRSGGFSPGRPDPGQDFAGLKALLVDADALLDGVAEAELDDLEDKPVVFSMGERRMPFVAADFLMSFSQPNYYFHATMMYAILRHGGVPLGKMDFMGRVRMSR
jgi:hypothetical protein